MYAFRGDRVRIKVSSGGAEATESREALVLSADYTDGRPPYWVRWADSGEESLLFPGPAAMIDHSGPTYMPEYDGLSADSPSTRT